MNEKCGDCKAWRPEITIEDRFQCAHCDKRKDPMGIAPGLPRKKDDPCCPQCELRSDAIRRHRRNRKGPNRVSKPHGTL